MSTKERDSKASNARRFVERMESKRLARECPYILDMRGKTPGKCRPVRYGERTFHVDDVSYSILMRGLEKTHGVFTFGLYEAIINAGHTFRARHRAQDDGQGQLAPTDEPGVLEFGYYHRRKEPRIDIVADVGFECHGIDFEGVTRDLSPSGLSVSLKTTYGFVRGEELTVDLRALDPEGSLNELPRIRYRVLNTTAQQGRVDLVLGLADPERRDFTRGVLTAFIEANASRYKIDVGDELSTTAAYFYERIHSDNTRRLPLFFSARDGDWRLTKLALNRHNKALLEFFSCPGGHDLSPFSLLPRLQHLMGGSDMLMLLVRGEQGLWSCTNMEVEHSAWLAVLRRFQQEPGAKILHLDARLLSPEAIADALRRQQEILEGETASSQAATEWGRLGLLVQVTDLSNSWRELRIGAVELGEGACWRGLERRRFRDGELIERLAADTSPPPELHEVFTGSRREERYRAKTRLEIQIGQQRFAGVTRDISIFGLQAECEGAPPLQRRDPVSVALTTLQQRRPGLDLGAIPYRVARVEQGEKAHLMLERVVEQSRDPYWGFFKELISANKGSIEVDDTPQRSTFLARTLGSIAAPQLAALPFFVRIGSDGTPKIEYCAVAAKPNGIAEFFRDGEGRYDFGALTTPQFLAALEGLQFRRSEGVEFNCRFSKTPEGILATPEVLRAVGPDRPNVLHTQVMVQKIQPFSETQVEQAALKLFEQSRYKALRFRQTLDRIIAVGEIVNLRPLLDAVKS